MTAAHPAPRLERQTFSTSRLAEFASRAGLTSATGFPPEDWPAYALKELLDNSIDDSEEHNTPPRIRVKIADDGIIVADRGSGLTGEIIERILDYTQRTSAREAYVSPTRGAQGNALQTLLALPFALDGEQGQVTIEAHGQAHDIEFGIHPLTREPQVRRATGASSVRIGTQTKLHWPDSACSILTDAKPRFLPIVKAFAVLNPHSSTGVSVDGDDYVQFDPTNSEWRKWTPSAPTSAHWYDIERFERLIAAYVIHGKGERLIRDFLTEFAGLSGTANRKAVLHTTGLARAALRSLCSEDRFDNTTVALLHAMQLHSRPVKPKALGVIGPGHWQVHAATYGGDLDSFSYKRISGESDSLPWLIEVAFCHAPDAETRTLVTGINFSPTLRDPFQNLGTGYYAQSLDGLLAHQYAGRNEPVIVFVHFTCPRTAFTDRGKAGVTLPHVCAKALADAVTTVTKKWTAQRKHEDRDRNARVRRREVLARQPRADRITIKDAAEQLMAAAYEKASGGYPAKARQIMYAARPGIIELTGKTKFEDKYFTQNLLPDYVDATRRNVRIGMLFGMRVGILRSRILA